MVALRTMLATTSSTPETPVFEEARLIGRSNTVDGLSGLGKLVCGLQIFRTTHACKLSTADKGLECGETN